MAAAGGQASNQYPFSVVLNSEWRVDAHSFAALAAYPFVCGMGFSDRINKIYKIEPPFTDA